MKVNFEKTDFGWTVQYANSDWYLDRRDFLKTINEIKKIFKSFRVDKSRYTYDDNALDKRAYHPELIYFHFDIQEDEDYFQVWSSQGIEI
jgi:hypothetical protein